jgi:fatty-acyl-CoA synthase
VADAGVVGLADPLWGEAISAYVVLGTTVSLDELFGWCRERLDAFKVPKAIRPVPELPRNANGKLLRNRLDHLESPPR